MPFQIQTKLRLRLAALTIILSTLAGWPMQRADALDASDASVAALGQLVANNVHEHSVAVHASTSGKVRGIEMRPVAHPSGQSDHCIVIDVDGKDEWIEPLAKHLVTKKRRVHQPKQTEYPAHRQINCRPNKTTVNNPSRRRCPNQAGQNESSRQHCQMEIQ